VYSYQVPSIQDGTLLSRRAAMGQFSVGTYNYLLRVDYQVIDSVDGRCRQCRNGPKKANTSRASENKTNLSRNCGFILADFFVHTSILVAHFVVGQSSA